MVIAHNIAATNTYNKMGVSSKSADKSMEKLSSGYKINRAADDAAGLSISEKMRSQIRGLNQASDNAQQGISMIQTAEGALNEAHSICQRMRELAVQAANDTNAASDREALQSEIDQLTSEINRIGNTTEFNGMKLLNGSKVYTTGKEDIEVAKKGASDISLVHGTSGINNTAKLELAPGGDKFTINASTGDGATLFANLQQGADKNTIVIGKEDGALKLTMKLTNSANESEQVISDSFTFDSANDTYVYNNHGLSIALTKKSVNDFLTNGANTDTLKLDLDTYVKSLSTTQLGAADTETTVTGTTSFTLKGTKYSFGINDEYNDGSSTLCTVKDVNFTNEWKDNTRIDYDKVTIKYTATSEPGATATGKLDVTYMNGSDTVIAESYNIACTGSDYTYTANGFKFTLDQAGDIPKDSFVSTTIDLDQRFGVSKEKGNGTETDNSVYFHVGANTNQVINTTFGDMRAKSLNLTGTGYGYTDDYTVNDGTSSTLTERGLNISTREGANNAIDVIDKAVTAISQERSKYGAIQNRLEYTINNVDTTSENMTSAESTIRDVDMASEMMELTKNQILQQASQAMLSQAMQRPQQVLQLLQG